MNVRPQGISLRPEPESSAIALLAWDIRAKAVAARTHHAKAVELLAEHAPVRAQRNFANATKAAVGAGNTVDSNLTSAVSIGEWSASAGVKSAFYYILGAGDFWQQPMDGQIEFIASPVTAAVVPEGAAIPVNRSTLTNKLLTPEKVGLILTFSDKFVLAVDPYGRRLFERELLNACSKGADKAFTDKILIGTTPISSTTPFADVRALVNAVSGGEDARPYFIAAPDVAKLAATLSMQKSGAAFAGAAMRGGTLAGAPLLVSYGLANGTLILLDANQIVANGETPEFEVSWHTSLQMDDAPTMNSTVPTGTTTVSTTQTNTIATKCFAIFAAEKLRSTACASVVGIDATKWAAT